MYITCTRQGRNLDLKMEGEIKNGKNLNLPLHSLLFLEHPIIIYKNWGEGIAHMPYSSYGPGMR